MFYHRRCQASPFRSSSGLDQACAKPVRRRRLLIDDLKLNEPVRLERPQKTRKRISIVVGQSVLDEYAKVHAKVNNGSAEAVQVFSGFKLNSGG